MNMRKHWKWIFIAPLAMIAMALFAYLGGKAVEWLWNWLLPPLFGWHTVTFWQALGMLVLCRILFGGSGFMGTGNSSKAGGKIRRPMVDRIGDRNVERFDQMTPEEQERLWERLQERRAAPNPGAGAGA